MLLLEYYLRISDIDYGVTIHYIENDLTDQWLYCFNLRLNILKKYCFDFIHQKFSVRKFDDGNDSWRYFLWLSSHSNCTCSCFIFRMLRSFPFCSSLSFTWNQHDATVVISGEHAWYLGSVTFPHLRQMSWIITLHPSHFVCGYRDFPHFLQDSSGNYDAPEMLFFFIQSLLPLFTHVCNLMNNTSGKNCAYLWLQKHLQFREYLDVIDR